MNPHLWGRSLKIAPIPLVMGTAGLTLLLFAPLAWIAGKAYQNFNNIQQNEFRLRQLSDQITYYDEVLTMSARMNAATAVNGKSAIMPPNPNSTPSFKNPFSSPDRCNTMPGMPNKPMPPTWP
jgi:hypothetical protein